jgi:hypothetical protein
MLGSSILEVALGIGLFFLLLAVICTSINEIIARFLGLRADNLRSGIGELLGDPKLERIAKDLYDHPLIKPLEKTGRPSYIYSKTFAKALVDTLREGATTVVEVQKALNEDPTIPKELKRQLTILINDADNDFDELRKEIGFWFDHAMSRVSGWYKRKTQVVTFVVAVFLVGLLNADTLAVANGMIKNPAAREAFVAQASALIPTGQDGVPKTDIEAVQAALDPLGFEIGWADVDQDDPLGWYLHVENWLGHLPGWAITIFAIMLGAPFWFDLLGKVANIRSTGNRPQTSSAFASEI